MEIPRTKLSAGQAPARDRAPAAAPPRGLARPEIGMQPRVMVPRAAPRPDLARWNDDGPPTRRTLRWSDRDDEPHTTKPPADVQPLVIGAALAAAAVLLGVVAWQLADTFDPGGWPGKGDGEGGGPAPILRVARRMIPCDFRTPLRDEILGGAIGPGQWKLHEKGYGTTCGIAVGYVLEQAGADQRLSNRGDRFKVGAHISRLYEGARRSAR